jgi:hypothetical protein
LKFIERGTKFSQRAFILRGELYQHRGVFDFAAEAIGFFYGGLIAASLFENFLRSLLIAPEFRLGYLFFQTGEFRAFRIGVKETS